MCVRVRRSLIIGSVSGWEFILEISAFWCDGRRIISHISFDMWVVLVDHSKKDVWYHTVFVDVAIKNVRRLILSLIDGPVVVIVGVIVVRIRLNEGKVNREFSKIIVAMDAS